MRKFIQKISIIALAFALTGCGTNKSVNTPTDAEVGIASNNDASNEAVTNVDKVKNDAISFSVGSGFYEEEFEVSVTSKDNATIYYTLDGSDPSTSDTAMEYTGAIKITDKKNDANVVSAVSPQEFCSSYSTYSKKNGLECYINAPGDSEVDKCTVLRVAAKNGEEVVATSARTYFIGSVEEHIEGTSKSCQASGTDLAVISITMNYEDLFSDAKGIYVKGNIFKNSLSYEIAQNKNFTAENARKIPANYNQRGREWERSAHMEMFEVNSGNTTEVLNQDCGIRVQGNYSRSDLQKSFRLYAREDYGKKNFKYEVFGEDAVDKDGVVVDSFKTMILRAGGNCAFTAKYNDTYWQHLAKGVDCDTKASRPCVVYLNGEYWGLYVLEEDYSTDYFQEHYGVEKDQVVCYKGDAETYACGYKLDLGEIPEGEAISYYYKDLLDFFASHKDLKSDADYEEFAKLVDVDSVMDYFAVEVWINNKWDWPGKNWSMWRTLEVDATNEYADGRWRFSLYDIEFGGVSGGSDAGTNTVKEDNYKPNGLLDFGTTNPAVLCFAYLMTNDSFNEAYCERLDSFSSTIFEKQHALEVLTKYEDTYGPLFDQFYDRYKDSGSTDNALNGGYASSKCIRDFVEKRAENIQKIIDYCKTTEQ